jgi:hypothetical protein
MATAKKHSSKKPANQTCWPGFKHVPGTKAGTKGSCEKKPHQTASEKKADSRVAAATKRKKAA